MRSVKTLKDWQIEAFQLGRPARHFLIQSPGGAGKSLLQVILAQADIEDTGNKQLILVPKNHIHHGFYDEQSIQLVLPGQEEPSGWVVHSNFCSTSKSEAKTRLLRDYLLSDVRELRRRGQLAAIATHRAIVGPCGRGAITTSPPATVSNASSAGEAAICTFEPMSLSLV